MEMEYPNLEEICRLCLKENSGTIDIFQDTKLSIPLRIMTTSTIEVRKSDGLPSLICEECRIQLERAYIFRKKCQRSDTKLRKHIRLLNCNKTSKVFEKNEDDEDYENTELEDSLNFISVYENMQTKLSEDKFKEREMKLYEKFRTEETNRIFEEFQNFMTLKNCKKETPTNIVNHFEVTPAPVNSKPNKHNSPNSFSIKLATGKEDKTQQLQKPPQKESKQFMVLNENHETNELILIVENTDDDDDDGEHIDLAEYNIEEDNEIYTDYDEENIEYAYNDSEKDMKKTMDSQNSLNEEVIEEENINDENINESAQSMHLIKTEVSKAKTPNSKSNNDKKITSNIRHATVGTRDGKIIEMKVYKSGKSEKNDIKIESAKSLAAIPKEEVNVFKCSVCPQSFTRRLLLVRHHAVHTKSKNYSCSFCQKGFACKSSLDRHIRTHTGEKPFECKECGKKFIQKEILKRHMHTHTGQKPFSCPHCDMSFVQKQVLNSHINAKHTQNPTIKLHACFLCPKTFMHASGLSRHLLFHTGVTYNCNNCDKIFNDVSALKRHKLALHSRKK